MDPKIFELDGASEPGEVAWGSEKEEEREEHGHTRMHRARHTRTGRRERAAARAEDQAEGVDEIDCGGGEVALGPAETTLYRATAARANYLALDRPELVSHRKSYVDG